MTLAGGVLNEFGPCQRFWPRAGKKPRCPQERVVDSSCPRFDKRVLPVAAPFGSLFLSEISRMLGRCCRDATGALALAALSMLIALALNSVRKDALPLRYESPEERFAAGLTALLRTPAFSSIRIDAIGLDQFRTVVAGRSALILDARAAPYYQQGHVSGALNLSRDHFANDYERLMPVLQAAKDRPIVVYCSGGACRDSKMVARALFSLGYSNLRVFTGGWEAWTTAGLPVAR